MNTLISLPLGVQQFVRDMGTTPAYIAGWASLFPFPQFLVGGYYCWSVHRTTIGFSDNPAAWYLGARCLSFVVAGQVSLRYPFTKMVGPIMHIPFLAVVPASFHWLISEHNHLHKDDASLYYFIAYTTSITSVSLVLDAVTFCKWATGGEVGYIASVPPEQRANRIILAMPSLLMLLIGEFLL